MRYVILGLLFFVALVPQSAAAASPNFFGPIVPAECHCDAVADPVTGEVVRSAPAFGCVLQTVQNVIKLAISLALVLATLAIIYAALVWITGRGNPEKISQGRTLLLNVFIGLVVMLSAWIIVDYVMKLLYSEPTDFGPWNSILAATGDSAGICLKPTSPKSLTSGAIGTIHTNPLSEGGTGGTGGGPASGGGTNGSCTPIADSNLVAIDSSGHKLVPDAARRFAAMKAAAAASKINLVVSSAYRSPDDQLRAWNQNGCNIVSGKVKCRERTAAIPCSLGGNGSNHTRGTAVDITLNKGVYAWLQQHAGQFGFYNKLPNDLPHWSDTGQ